MAANLAKQRKTEQMRQRAWELHLKGANQWTIAAELGVTQGRVSQLIKAAAKAHPVVALSIEERIALSEARWQQSEDELIEQIAYQRVHGRVTTERVVLPDGGVQVKEIHVQGVDPALLRALSTHHDRRARQLNNQMAPDATMSQVNVNVVKDFLNQGETKGSLSAANWNEQQEGVIDV